MQAQDTSPDRPPLSNAPPLARPSSDSVQRQQRIIKVAPPAHEYRTHVNIEPILKSVADKPRHHLGSILYNPKIGVPSFRAASASHQTSLAYDKFGYTSTVQPPPRFYGKENCTFTVRVPRWYLTDSKREEICYRHALWGTGVYTDDSDPVAAAMHSGFFRGSWSEEVDIKLLDLVMWGEHGHAARYREAAGSNSNGDKSKDSSGSTAVEPTTDKQKTPSPMSLPPRGVSTSQPLNMDGLPLIPPEPVAGKDLHITLLVLPPLQKYESSIMYGIRSRPWGKTHDGMSFMVLRIDWVDEGVNSRGQDRGASAKRKRMKYLMDAGMIWTPQLKEAEDRKSKSKVRAVGSSDGPSLSQSKAVISSSCLNPSSSQGVLGAEMGNVMKEVS